MCFHFTGELDSEEAITNFSNDFITDKRLVKKYVSHLKELQLKKQKREESRKRAQNEERMKTYEDYNWGQLYRDGQLKKLKLSTLELYIEKNKLNCRRGMIKQDKVDVITAHIVRHIVRNANTENDESDTEDEDEEDDALVVHEIGSDSEDSDSDSDESGAVEESDMSGTDLPPSSTSENNMEDNINNDEIDVDVNELLCTTRSGRTCRTWKGRSLYQ